MEQQNPPRERQCLAGPSSPRRPAAPATGSRIEEYLDRVCAPLVASLPEAKRLEIREELQLPTAP